MEKAIYITVIAVFLVMVGYINGFKHGYEAKKKNQSEKNKKEEGHINGKY